MSMPRVGSKQSSVLKPDAIQRAMTTFCMLPPLRRRTSAAARVSICSFATAPSTRRRSSAIGIGPQLRNPPKAASATFSCTERCGRSETSRLAGTRTRPARIASAGCRSFSRRPSAHTSPPLARRTPAMQSNNSSCPCPSSAVTPSTSPRSTRKETPRSAWPWARPRTSSAGIRVRSSGAASRRIGATTDLATSGPSIRLTMVSSAPLVAVTPTVTPSRNTVARSQRAATSARRWEMKITLEPRCRQLRTAEKTRSDRSAGSAAVISSSIRI